MEMSGPSVSRHGRTVKRKRWGGLRQQLKLLGLFEIDQQHEFYSLTCMMKEGLSAAVQNNPLRVSIPVFMNLHPIQSLLNITFPFSGSLKITEGKMQSEQEWCCPGVHIIYIKQNLL